MKILVRIKHSINRAYNYTIASWGGYFWLPCPICGEHFGGHEISGSLMTSWDSGVGVCKNCFNEAARRNALYMKNTVPLVRYIE